MTIFCGIFISFVFCFCSAIASSNIKNNFMTKGEGSLGVAKMIVLKHEHLNMTTLVEMT